LVLFVERVLRFSFCGGELRAAIRDRRVANGALKCAATKAKSTAKANQRQLLPGPASRDRPLQIQKQMQIQWQRQRRPPKKKKQAAATNSKATANSKTAPNAQPKETAKHRGSFGDHGFY
jgi:hypothetical protein